MKETIRIEMDYLSSYSKNSDIQTEEKNSVKTIYCTTIYSKKDKFRKIYIHDTIGESAVNLEAYHQNVPKDEYQFNTVEMEFKETDCLLAFMIYSDNEFDVHCFNLDLNANESHREIYTTVASCLRESDGFYEDSNFTGGLFFYSDLIVKKEKEITPSFILGATYEISGDCEKLHIEKNKS
jgi:hypothetical protein